MRVVEAIEKAGKMNYAATAKQLDLTVNWPTEKRTCADPRDRHEVCSGQQISTSMEKMRRLRRRSNVCRRKLQSPSIGRYTRSEVAVTRVIYACRNQREEIAALDAAECPPMFHTVAHGPVRDRGGRLEPVPSKPMKIHVTLGVKEMRRKRPGNKMMIVRLRR